MKQSRIVIDPGHGLPDAGAVGPTGLTEQEVVLDVGRRLCAYLRGRGFDAVMMTRTGEEIAGGFRGLRAVSRSLVHRVKVAVGFRAELFVSLHCNGAESRGAHGFEVFHNALGDDLAEALFKRMRKRLQSHHPRRTTRANYYVLRKAQEQGIPAALVELEFITNPNQEAIFRKETSREFYAVTVGQGIEQYLKDVGAA